MNYLLILMLNIHETIKSRLDYFIEKNKIPNIIFHGPSGSGKRTLVNEFINKIYNNDKKRIDTYVLNVNCAHGKGIKFVREDLKYFAKTNVNVCNQIYFKTIILSNADELTIDAQSALRRCIELFNHTTRFIIIIEDKYKLLKPIISRFCDIYIPHPKINNISVNLYKNNIERFFDVKKDNQKRIQYVKKQLDKCKSNMEKSNIYNNIIEIVNELYEKSYSGLDILNYIEKYEKDEILKYKMLLLFYKIKKEFKNDKLFMLYILNIYIIRSDYNLENISFI